MRKIEFTVEGQPIGKGRPRFSTASGFPRAYTPKKTADYEKYVRQCIPSCDNPIEGTVSVNIRAYMKIPKANKKITELMREGVERPINKPDPDNIAKTILDAMNGVVYADDSQVVELKASKYYSDYPRVEITITEIVE